MTHRALIIVCKPCHLGKKQFLATAECSSADQHHLLHLSLSSSYADSLVVNFKFLTKDLKHISLKLKCSDGVDVTLRHIFQILFYDNTPRIWVLKKTKKRKVDIQVVGGKVISPKHLKVQIPLQCTSASD